MGSLKINGRDIRARPKSSKPPAPAVSPIAVPRNFRDPYADPFPPPNVSEPELAASWLAESGLWCQQMIEELAAAARKLDRLTAKLQDPALADSPHRPDAVTKARRMEVDMINRVRDIAWHEAEADRTWRALTPDQRMHANAVAHWMTDPQAPSLIGRAWQGIGAFETWPLRWRLERKWFEPDTPYKLILDMRAAGVFDWDPNPYTGPDPFGGPVKRDVKLAKQLSDRGVKQ